MTKVVLSNTQERVCATAFVPGLRRDLRTRFSVGIYVPYRPSTGDPYVNAVSLREKDGRVHGRVRVWNTGASQAPEYKVLDSWASRARWAFSTPRSVTMCVPHSRTPVDPAEGAHGAPGEQPERKRWHRLARHPGTGPVAVTHGPESP